MERKAEDARTRESSNLTSNKTSPKPFGGTGSVKLADSIGLFAIAKRVVPTCAVELVINSLIASYLPDVIWAEAITEGRSCTGDGIKSIVGEVSVTFTHPFSKPNPYVWN